MDTKKHRYRLWIDASQENTEIPVPEFPSLRVVYLNAVDRLCDRRVKCVWEGDLRVTLRVNNERITLNDHDSRENKMHRVDDFVFVGEAAHVEHLSNDKDRTYLIFTISQEQQQQQQNTLSYNLNQPFLLEFTENPSTGYSWYLELPSGIKLLYEAFSSPGTHNRVGFPGTRTFVVHGIARGKMSIRAIHTRPWAREKTVEEKQIQLDIV